MCRQVLAQLKLLLADSKDPDVQQRAAEQLQHIVQAAPGAAEVVGAVMPLVFGVLQAVPGGDPPAAVPCMADMREAVGCTGWDVDMLQGHAAGSPGAEGAD